MLRWILISLLMLAPFSAVAADFLWVDEHQTSQRLEQIQGQPVVVHLWASWCPPCRAELKAFDQWRQRHPDVQVLMVSLDKERQDAVDFLHKVGIDRKVLMSDPQQARKLGANSLPTTVVVLADGSIGRIHRGPRNWNDESFSSQLIASLKPPL